VKTAVLQLSEVVDTVRETEKDEPLEAYEKHLFGRLLQLLGSLTHDKDMLKLSVVHFHELSLEENWTEHGKAAIHREIGDGYRYAGEWDLAERAYLDAIKLEDADLVKVHVAECLLYRKQIEAAAREIDTVRREKLLRHEFEDFVFAYAAIAIWTGKSERLTDAKSLLQELETAEPLFNERRLSLLVRVTETLASGKASTEAKSDSTPEGGLATVSSFLKLEPNIFGIGINLNAIINYFARKAAKSQPKTTS
jgi:tetratricopeptide (TPR) repeat protein